MVGTVLTATAIFGAGMSAADPEPTRYAVINDDAARAIIEVRPLEFGGGYTVTARVHRPDIGLVAFCLFPESGGRNCQTVNPDFSGFDRSDRGCVQFTVQFSEDVTHGAITTPDLITVVSLAPLTEVAPKNLGMLNACRR